jgi:hypothetical protein
VREVLRGDRVAREDVEVLLDRLQGQRGARRVEVVVSEFRLYPVERHWWPFEHYRVVKTVVERLSAKRVLEFGPGWSTLAIVEGGATQVHTCETDPVWFERHESHLALFPEVRMHLYVSPYQLLLSDGFDLAFVDAPVRPENRWPEIDYAWRRSRAVLLHQAHLAVIREFAERLAGPAAVEIIPAPYRRERAAAFALVTRP